MRVPPRRANRATEAPDISVEPLRYNAGDVVADKYRLEELRGKGAMGSVWRATNTALGVDVAIKLVHGEIVSAETTERLQREAHAAARIEHPSAVRIFDFGLSDLGDPFIAMELLRGESLRELFETRQKLPAKEVIPLLLPIVSALAAAHQKGITHRDLKPENIVVVNGDDGPVPKIVDFGLAKVESAVDTRATASGVLMGSPEYMSPEQARAEMESVGPRSDVWAIGVILYEALSGKPPFASPSLFALLRAINELEPPTLESTGDADAQLSSIVARALAKDPDARWPSMRAFGRALAEWALANGVDADATGASISAMWIRPSRSSMSSVPGSLPGDASSSMPSPPPAEDSRAPSRSMEAPAVWQPAPAPRRSTRWGLVVGMIVASVALLGGALFLMNAARKRPETPVVSDTRASAPATGPSAAAPSTPASAPTVAAATAMPSSAPSAAPAASTAVPNAPAAGDISSCVAAIFPENAFDKDVDLRDVCTQPDPRKTASLLRSRIASHGFEEKATTDAMRLWANLSWYELAAVGLARGACCPSPSAIELPPPVGTCPPLATAIDGLAASIRSRAEVEGAVTSFREAARCTEHGYSLNAGVPSPYGYRGPPGGGAESAFRRLLERAPAH